MLIIKEIQKRTRTAAAVLSNARERASKGRRLLTYRR